MACSGAARRGGAPEAAPQAGVRAAGPPEVPVGECCGSHFRRHLYAAPDQPLDPRLWQCSGCYGQNFKASDPICRLCGTKSPDLQARDERERRRLERAQRRQEEAWRERERTGCLAEKDIHAAFLSGCSLRGENVVPKAQRHFDEEDAKEMIRKFARAAGHEPEF